MIVADPAVEVSPIDTFQGGIWNLEPTGWWMDLRRDGVSLNGIWNLELVGAYAKPDMVSVKAMASAQHI